MKVHGWLDLWVTEPPSTFYPEKGQERKKKDEKKTPNKQELKSIRVHHKLGVGPAIIKSPSNPVIHHSPVISKAESPFSQIA